MIWTCWSMVSCWPSMTFTVVSKTRRCPTMPVPVAVVAPCPRVGGGLVPVPHAWVEATLARLVMECLWINNCILSRTAEIRRRIVSLISHGVHSNSFRRKSCVDQINSPKIRLHSLVALSHVDVLTLHTMYTSCASLPRDQDKVAIGLQNNCVLNRSRFVLIAKG